MPSGSNITASIPHYRNLDLSGEVRQAVDRMEARPQEPASQEMFQELVAPLLTEQVRTICEFGCGTAALSRKIAKAAPHTRVYASDKSEGMLQVARQWMEQEQISNIELTRWDVLETDAWPFPQIHCDLIISSVVIPYLNDDQTAVLINTLSSHLAPGGVLAFVEQDLMSDSVNFWQYPLMMKVMGKDTRTTKRTVALGLRPYLRQAGLALLPRRSFLWTEDHYGPYARDLLERFADAACNQGLITREERDGWKQAMESLAASGDFYYGIVYHRIAGRQEPTPS